MFTLLIVFVAIIAHVSAASGVAYFYGKSFDLDDVEKVLTTIGCMLVWPIMISGAIVAKAVSSGEESANTLLDKARAHVKTLKLENEKLKTEMRLLKPKDDGAYR
jgi:hypothetical protein